MDNSNQNWVSAWAVFSNAKSALIAAGAPVDEAAIAAESSILNRAVAGIYRARCRHFEMKEEHYGEWDLAHKRVNITLDADGIIDPGIWRLALSPKTNWLSGDFEFSGSRGHVRASGVALGVEFIGADLSTTLAYPAPGAVRAKGRPPATWWADFAEELALHVHENGPPPGEGRSGQSAYFEAIELRMAERSGFRPDRATVMPVIGNVLERIRSSGK